MKELEKIVKESFQDFEPEVNPSVWQRLEQNLPASQPVDPSAAASAGKGAAALSGKVTAWIAGAITTAVVTTAVILSVNSVDKQESAPEINQAVQVESPNPQSSGETAIAQEAVTEENIPARTNEKAQVVRSIQKPEAEKELIQSETAEGQQKVYEPVADNNSSEINKEAVSENKKEDMAQPAPVQKIREETKRELVKKAEPVIIVSSDCGFAPLKVIAMLNQENNSGNWDFGDGYALNSTATATHVYDKPGTYELTYTDGKETINRSIEVIGTISTAFTPNGDGLNDEFFINASLTEISMKIFDRSGHLAIEISNPEQRWDGRNFKGEDLPSGTYFYDIFARSANGKAISQKGTINIFR